MGITNREGALYFATGIDNSGLRAGSKEASMILKSLGNDAAIEGDKMKESFSGAASALAALGGTAALGMLGKEILETTAKFEKFGIVLRNTLGNDAGNQALDMISQFAATTPFQLDEVTAAFIKMANQGFVPTREEMVKLGDLASTTGKSFDQLTEALLDAQTGQFERLKEFGIKASSQGDKVTFSFREQQTTVDNTNSAIQKYILSLGELKGVQGSNALISASLTGQISNLEDKLAAMYNTIGSSNSGVLYAAVGGVTSLIDNYETVGKVLLGLVATYGIYKTTVITVNAISALQAEIAYQQMLANIGNTGATVRLTTAQGLQAIMASRLTALQLALNNSMLANPYVLATMAVLGLATAMAAYANSSKEAKTEKQMLNELESEGQQNTKQEVSTLETLKRILNDSNKSYGERKVALDKLKEIVPDYHADLTSEGKLINNNADALDTYVKKLVIAEKLKVAAAKQSNADEAFNNYKTENADVLKTALKKQVNGESLFSGEAGALEMFKQLATEAGNYGKVIDQLQSDLVSIDAAKIKKSTSETPAQLKARLAAEKKARLAAEKEAQKESDGEYNANQDLQGLLLDLQNQTAKLLLKNSEDNLKNRLNQIELEKNEEVQKITEKEVSIIDAYNKAHRGDKNFKPLSTESGNIQSSINTINPTLGKQLSDEELRIINAYGAKKAEATKKWGEEINDLALAFADKRVQIEHDYNKDIDLLTKEGKTEAVKLAIAERDKKISEVSRGLIEETSLYKAATNEQLNVSKETTDKLIADIKRKIAAELAAGNLSKETAKQMNEDIDKAQKSVSGKKNQNNPFAKLSDAVKGNSSAQKAFADGKLDPKTSTEDLAKLESAAKDATAAMADAAGASLAGAQDILKSVIGGLGELGLLTEDEKKTADEVVGMVSGAANLAMGIASGNPMQIIQGSIDMIVNGYNLFDSRTKDADAIIKKDAERIKVLQKEYEKLGTAIEKAFSTTKSKLIDQQNDKLVEQNKLIEEQKKAEESKKKSDQGKIDEYNNQIEANNKLLEENKQKRIDALTGTDVMSAIDSFAQAYADAWTSGEDAAKKSTDVVKNLLKTALVTYMKSQLQPQVEELMKMIAKDMEDGFLSAEEKADILKKQKEIDAKAAAQQSQLQDLGLNDSATKNGVTGELKASMTEGTASQLVGLWNMTAMDIRSIKEWLLYGNIVDSVKTVDVSASVVNIMNQTYLIQQNTRETADNTTGLIETLQSVQSELEEIKRNTNNTSSRG